MNKRNFKKKAAGYGDLSGDASDIMEGIILTNKDKNVAELLDLIKQDDFIMDEIEEMGISNEELESYIEDALLIYRIGKAGAMVTHDWFLDQLAETVDKVSEVDFSGKLKYGLQTGIDYYREYAENEWGYISGELFANFDIECQDVGQNSHVVISWHGSEVMMGYGVRDLDGGQMELAFEGSWDEVVAKIYDWASDISNKGQEQIMDIIEELNSEYVWIDQPESSQYYKGGCQMKKKSQDEDKNFGFALYVDVFDEDDIANDDWSAINEEMIQIERNVIDLMKNDPRFSMVRDEGHSDEVLIGTIFVTPVGIEAVEDIIDDQEPVGTGKGDFWYDESDVYAGVDSGIFYNITLDFFEA